MRRTRRRDLTCQASSSWESSSFRWIASNNWLFKDIMSFLLRTNSASIRFFLQPKEETSSVTSLWLDILHRTMRATHLAMASSRSLMACCVVSVCCPALCSFCLISVFSCCSWVFCQRKIQLNKDLYPEKEKSKSYIISTCFYYSAIYCAKKLPVFHFRYFWIFKKKFHYYSNVYNAFAFHFFTVSDWSEPRSLLPLQKTKVHWVSIWHRSAVVSRRAATGASLPHRRLRSWLGYLIS